MRTKGEDVVDFDLGKDQSIIHPVKKVREGWAEAFQKMSQNGDDQLLDENVQNEWDQEWEW